MARRIRVWKQGSSYHATLECIDRMFLLKPSPIVNNAIGSSLGRALAEYPIQLHSATTNINHMELVFSLGPKQTQNASRFLQLFESLAAKELNRHYGRRGHFWSSRAHVEEIVSDGKAEKLLGYGACNVVKDGLVEKAAHWRGFSTTDALLLGKKLEFEYVDRTQWWKLGADHREVDPAKYTQRVEIELTPLPSWKKLSKEARMTRFRHIVRDHEEIAKREREAEGITKVKGMERIEEESPFSKPRRMRERSAQPLCHADTKEQYERYAVEYREIANAHRIASEAYRCGSYDVEFPPGTFRPPLVTVVMGRAA
jgi:putative transposase